MAAINLLNLNTTNRTKLYQGQPGTTDTLLYTVPASTNVRIQAIVICNTTGTAATLTLNVGGAAAATNRILSAFSVQPNDTVTVDTVVHMDAADTIRALQGTNAALTVTISGEVYT